MRVRPFTRSTAVLTVALAAAFAGSASAQLPQLPDVPGAANETVTGVTNTVNNTAQTVGDALNDPTGPVTPVVPNTPVTRPSTGGGNSSQPAPAKATTANPSSAGGGSVGTQTPSASGGGRQATRRRAANRHGGNGGIRRTRAHRGSSPRNHGGPATPAAAATRAPAGVPEASDSESSNPVARVINRIDEVIPGPIKILIGVLALMAVGFALNSWFATRRARRLARQREELLGDVGLLQRALLPDVPNDLRGIDVSVAYRPAEGPAAGGDFYDVFELDGGRTAIIVGDVCGHGRAALAVTALMRYTLRAYAAAGFEPRVALQVAGRALDGDPDGALTTVVLAVYDPAAGTLTYACAGHEPPIVLGAAAYEPVTTFSSPPLGGFMATGHRQTTVALSPRSAACFFTDGLVEARLGDHMIGRERLSEILGGLEPGCGAQLLLDRIATAADRAPDDMAACLVRARDDAVAAKPLRVEELEADAGDLESDRAERFLAACGVAAPAAADALRVARAKAAEFGGAVMRVTVEGPERRVEVAAREPASLPVPSLEDPQRQAALELPRA